MRKNLRSQYHPLYFLASLGSGGLAVSFFMYLMFMVKHPKTPMPTFEHIFPALMEGNIATSILVGLALVGIIYFGYKHYRFLVWNISEYKQFKATEAFQKLKNSNAEVSLMAIPLTLAMSVNVLFVIGAAFIPGLWNYIDMMLPLALVAFLAIGVYAMKIFKDYFTRFIVKGDLDFVNNNNLSHMLTIFAFSMIAVGLAAPAAMSHVLAVSVLGIVTSIFFTSLALILTFIKMVLGFKIYFQNGD